MQGQINPKVVGATIVGFALVAGAYTLSNMGNNQLTTQPASLAVAATERVAISVVDSDLNGIEDWRDEFVTTEPIFLNQASSTYTPPETLTGQMGINFMENVIRARGYGPFGSDDDAIIQNTVDILGSETNLTLYDTPDITILEEWDDQDIVNYANTVAATIMRYDQPDLESELMILHDVSVNRNAARLPELELIATTYQNYRNDTLLIPVPRFLAKEHLDLINTYHAIYNDVVAMTQILEDPAKTLLRLKRYEDDATGFAFALQNMYLALEPHASLFTPEDPALLFVLFSPDIQI
jgi:hypothetical protein